MKKRIIFLASLLFLSVNFAQANQTENLYQMPTDEEIRATIEKYNFPPQEKERLFQETKKGLQDLYSPENKALLQQTINKIKSETSIEE